MAHILNTLPHNSKLKKGIFFTDIHFGKKSNSQLHNEDCLRFVAWMCDLIKQDPSIDYVGFLGDWFENRSAINIATINFAYQAARILNEIGLPVFFVVGNHDLYHRHTREIHSIAPYAEFSNFRIIDEPTIVNDIEGGAFFSPFLFHEEYEDLGEFLAIPFWGGHFEFKGFKITGYNIVMQSGPEPTKYAGPKRIFSGHFHQRQTQANITYIGNAFPMDFGDAGDFARGVATYDHTTHEYAFFNWEDCPKYVRVKASKATQEGFTLPTNARVKCVLDVDLSFEEGKALREHLLSAFSLRELTLEEHSDELTAILTDTEGNAIDSGDQEVTTIDDVSTVDQLVIQMLAGIVSDKIDSAILVEQYKRLA